MFEGKADELASATTRLFLGVNTQCAQCHDHPYTDMKQEDFWGIAAFYARTKSQFNTDDMFLKKTGATCAGVPAGETTLPGGWYAIPGSQGEAREVSDLEKGEVTMPFVKDPKPVPPAYLGGEPMPEQNRDRRTALAEWVTRPANPFFARNIVNRMWRHFTGRGFVEPVDGFGDTATPDHAMLLQDLGDNFSSKKFYLKPLMRGIVLSGVYQRAAAATETPPRDYTLAVPRPLDPDQWHDSVLLATQYVEGLQHAPVDRARPAKDAAAPKEKVEFAVAGAGKPAAKPVADDSPAGKPKEMKAKPYEPPKIHDLLRRCRQEAQTVDGPTAMALLRMNGRLINDGIERGDRYEAVRKMEKPEQRLEEAFLTTLGRRPSEAEGARYVPLLSQEGGQAADDALADLFWVLMNSTEFETR
jgi:uncharacterized protein YjiS (DUF1127 family)